MPPLRSQWFPALVSLVVAGLLVALSTATTVDATPAYALIVLLAYACGARSSSLVLAAGLGTALVCVGFSLEREPLQLASLGGATCALATTWGATLVLLRVESRARSKPPYARLYSEVLDASRSPSIVLDAKLDVISINRTYLELFRTPTPRAELVGVGFDALDDERWNQPTLLERLHQLVSEEQGRGGFVVEVEQKVPGHRGLRALHVDARRVSRSERDVWVLLTIEDFTERKASLQELKRSHSNLRRTTAKLVVTEERLAQAERLEAIGRLAGGVAHDYNNMLTAILGFTELAADTLPEDHPVQRYLTKVRDSGEQSAALTRKLLAFGRKSILSPKVLDVNTVVEHVNSLLERLIGEDVDVQFMLSIDLAPVFVDATQIEQAIVNLAINARDAMPHGGELRLQTRNVSLDARQAREIAAELGPGDYVLLSVADTGEGMDEETLDHIFEPFFTTKDPGKGTGLGLASVHGFVRQSGGAIRAQSTLGQGSVFELYLPQVSLPILDVEPVAPLGNPGGGSETILVVEDEDVVRGVMHETLACNGYQVLLAANAEEGLRICRDYPEPIDLIVTDVVMPGMSGTEFIANLPPRRRGAKVLYTSGYTDTTLLRQGLDGERVMFLAKPMNLTELLAQVRGILDAATTPSR